MFDNLDTPKKKMIESLKKHLGNISKACDENNICRQTHYNWLAADEDYKKAVEDISEASIDHVESKLFEKINGVTVAQGDAIYTQPPSDTAIIFYLKTKGKKRGYVERTEVDQTITVDPINLIFPDDAP